MDLKKVNPLDITSRLAKVTPNRYKFRAVGIELEGGWSKLPQGTTVTHDGSVRFSSEELLKYSIKHSGEIPSVPLAAAGDPSKPDHWANWLRTFYPTYSNESCGMHVHMSFRRVHQYQVLMDPRYDATIVAEITKWAEKALPKTHHIWPRLRGDNQYCQLKHWASSQAQQKRKDYRHEGTGTRYTAINYCFSLGNRETLEVRLLPMMPSVELATQAIKLIFDVTTACLAELVQREIAQVISIPIIDDSPIERIHLTV